MYGMFAKVNDKLRAWSQIQFQNHKTRLQVVNQNPSKFALVYSVRPMTRES